MKKLALASLMLLSFFISACTTANVKVSTGAIDDGRDDLYRSVGIIEIMDGEQRLGAGTVFAYDEDHLLTAGHVCMAALEIQVFRTRFESLQIKTFDDRGEMTVIDGATVKDISTTDDICMIEREDHDLKPVKMNNHYDVKVRDDVLIVGAPIGLTIGEYPGKIMNPVLESDHGMLKDRLVVSSATTGGISGSPVFNDHNEVIGILVAGYRGFDHLSICVNGDAVLNFLEEFEYR